MRRRYVPRPAASSIRSHLQRWKGAGEGQAGGPVERGNELPGEVIHFRGQSKVPSKIDWAGSSRRAIHAHYVKKGER